MENKLAIKKTIYAKRKGTFDKQLAAKVFNNEIHQHLIKHPELEFIRIDEPVSNPDLSKTFTIRFGFRKQKQQS